MEFKAHEDDLRLIRAAGRTGVFRFTLHAEKERMEDGITASDAEETLINGDVLEAYPEDRRGRSYLLLGYSVGGGSHFISSVHPRTRNRWLLLQFIALLCQNGEAQGNVIAEIVGGAKMAREYGHCYYCGGKVEEQLRTQEYHRNERLIQVEAVPVGICTQCGEGYILAEVAKQIDKLFAETPTPEKTIEVPVYRLQRQVA